ncbi:MAG: hypothetical protein JSR59_23480 [Proteobacteria bacterium]|nr:hypothetical protein [Pseudomonadota bacterium]
MTTDTPTACAKCGGTLEEGFILDAAALNVGQVSRWVAGPPAVSFFFGINTSGRDQYPIRSYRCADCGFLENYARLF